MIEVLKYLFEKLRDDRPVVHFVEGQAYAVKSDGTLGNAVLELAPQFEAPTLNVSSLTALVTCYKSQLDGFPPSEAAFHVTSPTLVNLVSIRADEFGRRHIWAMASHVENAGFVFGQFYKPEDFLIAFRAGFLFNDMAVKVQRLCSSLTTMSGVSVADDGMSQVVTVTEGGVARTAVELPPEIPLIPWRTFRDAAPVESKFLLRMKAVKDSLPMIAIFEIDGKWKLDTIASVRKYLSDEIPDAVILA